MKILKNKFKNNLNDIDIVGMPGISTIKLVIQVKNKQLLDIASLQTTMQQEELEEHLAKFFGLLHHIS